MELSIISFTDKGRRLSEKIKELLEPEILVLLTFKAGNLYQWTKKQFTEGRGILFIGACGIAVRAISPCLKDKLSDVPVLVMDEAGQFVISILSGHFGGANELAGIIAGKIKATCVITTATDINQAFAVDVFARKNNLAIHPKEGIKKISSAILAKEKVTIAIEGDYRGEIPVELTYAERNEVTAPSILVSPYQCSKQNHMLQLFPKIFIIGIGCRKGKSLNELEHAVTKHLEQMKIPMAAVLGIASVTAKKEEAGLYELAEKYKLPFETFSQAELKRIPGDYTSSAFVEEQLGVDNVCERAAMAACGTSGHLILKKQAENGITIAIAEKKWSVSFDEI